MTRLGVEQQLRGLGGGDAPHFAGRRGAGGRRRAFLRAEAAENHAEERAVHRRAHDVAQDRAARSDQRAGDDQQVVRQHEARRRRRPARVAVQHRHDDRHVGAADRHHQVDAEERREDRLRRSAAAAAPAPSALTNCTPSTTQATTAARLSRCRPGSSSGLLRMTPCSLPNATTDPVKVIAPTKMPTNVSTRWIERFGAGRSATSGCERDREADEHRGRADEAVEDRDQLRHRRHLHARRERGADGAADRQHRQQHRVAGDARPERSWRARRSPCRRCRTGCRAAPTPAPTGRPG